MEVLLRPGEVLEELLGSGYRIIQSRRGYRYSLDSVLLAHFASFLPGRSALELGMGNGAASLLLARRRGEVKILGLELQEDLASQAQRSVVLNGLEGRVSVLVADWRAGPRLLSPNSFDLVLANPPYRALGSGRSSPRPQVALAKHGPQGGLEHLLRAAFWALRARGTLALIYHCSGLAGLIVSLRQAGLEPKRLRLVHSFPESEAEFALVSARKGARPELKALSPLILYTGRGRRQPSLELEVIYGSFRAERSNAGQAV
ncbi:MAG TPA: methyltransferase domain-containing protein [Candidatus Methylomirabilis sp.]